ncbi:MAG TPA: glutamate synthase [Chloroflexi bacterium]|nr:glutamate synthase [Chloroflexota bacterium]
MARWGHAVTVYEARPRPGGLLVYGIPSFKLSRQVVAAKTDDLRFLGVRFVTGVRIGHDLVVDELLDQFDAVFLGTGAEQEVPLNIPGEQLAGIYPGTDFLARANLSADYLPVEQRALRRVGTRVAVIGGGDTAMDCLRTAVRLGAREVTCVYRRSEAEMPGKADERQLAREEGACFEFLTAPVRFQGDDAGHVRAMECVRMRLGEPDRSGRRRPVPVEGSEFTIEVDAVVLALGYRPDDLIRETTPGLSTDRWGLIVANEAGRTSRAGVFAGGDNVRGPDLVVTAMVAGRKAAMAIHAYLQAHAGTPAPKVANVAGDDQNRLAALILPR